METQPTNAERMLAEWEEYLRASEHQVEVAKEQVAYWENQTNPSFHEVDTLQVEPGSL